MLKLEDIKAGQFLVGIERNKVVEVRFVESSGHDAVTVYYRFDSGPILDRMLMRSDEASIALADAGRPWSFDAAGDEFKLAAEAYRMSLAHLLDPMMAVHTSNVDPLPHQIAAVYESMLPRQPLRYVLADDPGAGKTIMAGLLIRELLMRADAQRILIVAPGSLVEQWQDELAQKFGLVFKLFSRELAEQSHSGNAFADNDLLVARVDQLSRHEGYLEQLKATQWDLVVVDEAHKLSAHYSGDKVKRTKRFELGELLASISRHFLLMTATPHNGKEEDFQLFLSLLDPDRFYGKFREGAQKVDVSDVMRRMVKEKLVKFDGTPLFPERRAYTVAYELSPEEQDLYDAVTDYVKTEFNRADKLDSARKGTVGFALTSLQRRLASSPHAIYQSLRRRRERLEERLRDANTSSSAEWDRKLSQAFAEESFSGDLWEADEALSAESYENLEARVVDLATASRSVEELEAEIFVLSRLENQAREVVNSDRDRKWDELSSLLQNTPEMRNSDGSARKIIIFTEHRDTLDYLRSKITGLIGRPDAVEVIHGSVKREDRRLVQERFRHDPTVQVLLATDAAGEGVNLQNANLMVNYDLPWNPNRLEQRFGRIHRIGQTEVCHLWNLVARGTREGEVFKTLFDKLEVEREALGGQVFDILGEVFEGAPLRELLLEAIRYGEDPAVRSRLHTTMEGVLDQTHFRQLIDANALCEDIMDANRLYAVKEEMDRAEARKLQPRYVQAFFKRAFEIFDGTLIRKEEDRYEIRWVPPTIRQFQGGQSNVERRNTMPVVAKYERICFDRNQVRLNRPGLPAAELIHPTHPLMDSLTRLTLDRFSPSLKRGAVLVDPADMGHVPRMLFILEHTIFESADPTRVASRRLQFVSIDENGKPRDEGAAPHLDLRELEGEQVADAQQVLRGRWISSDLERRAMDYASGIMASTHVEEVRTRRWTTVTKTLEAVRARLMREIAFQEARYAEYDAQRDAGKDVSRYIEIVRRTRDELTSRLEERTRALEAQRELRPASPRVLGGALVIPQGYFEYQKNPQVYSVDADARSRIEWLAMNAVMDAERALGNLVVDESALKYGWDVRSVPPPKDGKVGENRYIEVKGRVKGAEKIRVTSNEVRQGLNLGDKFILAVVFVDGDRVEGPYYVKQPFTQELDWSVSCIELDVEKILQKATPPC